MAAVHILQSLGQTAPFLSWFKLVNDTVTEPYLDEVFHIRQAQAYCNGDFHIWDTKITTPPGLYLSSYLFSFVGGCSLTALRAQNLYAIVLLSTILVRTYTTRGAEDEAWISNSYLNILLFPPLYFFSALYYTDVMSTLSVILCYSFFLYAGYNREPLWLHGPVTVVLGCFSLLLRQTNIFWIAIFPAAITLVHQIDRGQAVVKDSMHGRADGFGDSVVSVARTSYKLEVIYDLPVRDAWIEDYAKTIVSIAACTVGVATRPNRLSSLLLALLPYITLLVLFAAFIVWNGGVVLGDKSNHIATLHLPQMLYIWPLFAFFSWPVLYPYLLTIPLWLLSELPLLTDLETNLIFKRRQVLPRPFVAVLATLLACAIVHLNTIVHPFTLADNRHYPFYIFRLLTRRTWVKYAVTPLYTTCAWACIQALGARPPPAPPLSASDAKALTEAARAGEQPTRPLDLPNGTIPAKTSIVLIWLATCTLQLVTAPLVEPRYFILPWVFWRLHLPLQRSDLQGRSEEGERKEKATLKAWVGGLDHRMVLETAWLLCVNVVTCYIFLTWTFSWPQEPGKLQRFMW